MARRRQLIVLAPLAAALVVTGAGATTGKGTSGRVLLTYFAARGSKADPHGLSYGLCLARSDGSHAVQFAPFRRDGQKTRLIAEKATWSPSGKYVALFRGSWFVIADARGHIVRKLYNWVKRSGYADRDPVWSANGRWIAS
jgi:hypothetical protein